MTFEVKVFGEGEDSLKYFQPSRELTKDDFEMGEWTFDEGNRHHSAVVGITLKASPQLELIKCGKKMIRSLKMVNRDYVQDGAEFPLDKPLVFTLKHSATWNYTGCRDHFARNERVQGQLHQIKKHIELNQDTIFDEKLDEINNCIKVNLLDNNTDYQRKFVEIATRHDLNFYNDDIYRDKTLATIATEVERAEIQLNIYRTAFESICRKKFIQIWTESYNDKDDIGYPKEVVEALINHMAQGKGFTNPLT